MTILEETKTKCNENLKWNESKGTNARPIGRPTPSETLLRLNRENAQLFLCLKVERRQVFTQEKQLALCRQAFNQTSSGSDEYNSLLETIDTFQQENDQLKKSLVEVKRCRDNQKDELALFGEMYKQKRSEFSNDGESKRSRFDAFSQMPMIFYPNTGLTRDYKKNHLRTSLSDWKPTWKSSLHKKKSLAAFKSMEDGEHGEAFHDFQDKLLTHFETRSEGDTFTGTFVEYVILEVMHWVYVQKKVNARKEDECILGLLLVSRYRAYVYRSECRSRWGCNPVVYSDVYKTLILDAVRHKWGPHPKLFLKNVRPRHRKKGGT